MPMNGTKYITRVERLSPFVKALVKESKLFSHEQLSLQHTCYSTYQLI